MPTSSPGTASARSTVRPSITTPTPRCGVRTTRASQNSWASNTSSRTRWATPGCCANCEPGPRAWRVCGLKCDSRVSVPPKGVMRHGHDHRLEPAYMPWAPSHHRFPRSNRLRRSAPQARCTRSAHVQDVLPRPAPPALSSSGSIPQHTRVVTSASSWSAITDHSRDK